MNNIIEIYQARIKELREKLYSENTAVKNFAQSEIKKYEKMILEIPENFGKNILLEEEVK